MELAQLGCHGAFRFITGATFAGETAFAYRGDTGGSRRVVATVILGRGQFLRPRVFICCNYAVQYAVCVL